MSVVVVVPLREETVGEVGQCDSVTPVALDCKPPLDG